MDTAAIIGGKVSLKFALNMTVPGLGSSVDFAESVYELSRGNLIGAATSACFGLFDLYTLGVVGTAKELAKQSGKQAAINTAKEAAKKSSKDFGKQASKVIAMGTPKNIAIKIAVTSSDRAKKEIGKKLGKVFATGMVGTIVEEEFKRDACSLAIKGVGMGLIGSGGKGVTSSILEGAATGWLNSSAKAAIEYTPTLRAVSLAAKETARKCFQDEFSKELLLNTGKGLVTYNFS